ncbi:MAG: alpha-D-glucose phosphate-specific phosphoglucomutase, partial [Burkholderiaceae bacterium]
AEMTAVTGRDPGESYRALAHELGDSVSERFEAAATPEQKERLAKLSAHQIRSTDLAGEKILSVLTNAPGNDAPIGGVRVSAESGWFAARPSGTENIYKIYAESFQGKEHLQRILMQAQAMVDAALEVEPHMAVKPAPGSSLGKKGSA